MASQLKKLLVLAPLLAAWVGSDLATKHWADVTLADANHPIPIHVTEAETGHTVAEVLTDRLGLDDQATRAKVLDSVVRLPAAAAYAPGDRVFAQDGAAARASGFYVFWRDDPELPPRRVSKTERFLLPYWLERAAPGADKADVHRLAREHLAEVTIDGWLASRIRRLSTAGAAEILADRVHPISGALARVPSDLAVSAGDALLVRSHEVPVMGQWWKFVYAENTGAAFGFLKGVQDDVRETIFLVLTCLVFVVIGSILWRTGLEHIVVLFAMTSVLGGALGNFVDRVRYGYVIDFIDMDLSFIHWPTYNVADIAIVVGVVLLVLEITFNKNSPLVAREPKAG